MPKRLYLAAPFKRDANQDPEHEEEEEVFITSRNWRGKDNSLSRHGGTDQS